MPFNWTRSVVDCLVYRAQQWDDAFVYLDRFFIDSEPFSCSRRFFRIIFGRRQIHEIWYFCLKSLSRKQYWNDEEEYFSALPCLRRPVTFKSQFSCIWFFLQDLSQVPILSRFNSSLSSSSSPSTVQDVLFPPLNDEEKMWIWSFISYFSLLERDFSSIMNEINCCFGESLLKKTTRLSNRNKTDWFELKKILRWFAQHSWDLDYVWRDINLRGGFGAESQVFIVMIWVDKLLKVSSSYFNLGIWDYKLCVTLLKYFPRERPSAT